MFQEKIANIWNKVKFTEVCLVLVVVLLLAAICIISTSYYIRLFSGQFIEEQGYLLAVRRDAGKGKAGIVVRIDETEYVLHKKSFSDKTYGLKSHSDMEKLKTELSQKIGSIVNIEYVQLAKNSRFVMSLTVDGEIFVDDEAAKKDLIADENRYRSISIIIFLFSIILLVIILRYLRKK